MSTYSSVISEGLRPYVDEDCLARNAAAHPEMAKEFSGLDNERLDAVREQLLRVPVVHTFKDRRSLGEINYGGLTSSKELGYSANTHPIDTSLGLDEYVFTTWGEQGTEQYGSLSVMLDAAPILEGSVATPLDICAFAGGPHLKKTFEEQTPEMQQLLQNRYLNTMVHGRDWLEITARGIVTALNRNKAAYPPVYMGDEMALGELKYHGKIPPQYLAGTIGVETTSRGNHLTVEDFEDRMISLGFLPKHFQGILDWNHDPEVKKSALEKRQTATDVWRKLLDIK